MQETLFILRGLTFSKNYSKMYKLKHLLVACALLSSASVLKAQYLMDMIDTTKTSGQDLIALVKKFNHVRLSGYIQPQFQVAESEGSKSFAGGDFAAGVDNRFMLRRSRIKVDYGVFTTDKMPKVQFVFQFDATERAVAARDMWGRFFENKYNCFSLVTGMFARPFGYEINLSSGDRESPERGRMSQILMKTERDLGAMVVFSPQKRDHPLRRIEASLGVFNGQGLTATADYDKYKDIIGRIQLKNYPVSKSATLSVGGSILSGGIKQSNKTIYKMDSKIGGFVNYTDSTKIGRRAARTYLGLDAQLKIKTHIGTTEFRAEYITGTQTATSTSSETPATLPTEALYTRPFDGAYFYVLQGFGKKHQIGLKYDWYNPNTSVFTTPLTGAPRLTAADVKYSTFGFGYIFYVNDNFKTVLWYDIIQNEKNALTGVTEDLKDNVFTCRLQYRF
jgi:hypothetical protein